MIQHHQQKKKNNDTTNPKKIPNATTLKTNTYKPTSSEKMKLTNHAKFMHCLQIRRNIVATDAILDHPNSLVIEQANNRTYAAQCVLKKLLENKMVRKWSTVSQKIMDTLQGSLRTQSKDCQVFPNAI